MLQLLPWVIIIAIISALVWATVWAAGRLLDRRRRRRNDGATVVINPGKGREQDVEW